MVVIMVIVMLVLTLMLMLVLVLMLMLMLVLKRWMLCRLMVWAIVDAARRVIVIIGMPREVQTRTHYGREQIAQSGQPGARERTSIVNVQGCA